MKVEPHHIAALEQAIDMYGHDKNDEKALREVLSILQANAPAAQGGEAAQRTYEAVRLAQDLRDASHADCQHDHKSALMQRAAVLLDKFCWMFGADKDGQTAAQGGVPERSADPIYRGKCPTGKWCLHGCHHSDRCFHQKTDPVAEPAGQGETMLCDYSELSREALESHAARLAQQLADDRAIAFHRKYAIGPMMAPSCLVCGKVPLPPAIKHAELPGIVVCQICVDAARRVPEPTTVGDGLAWQLALIAQDMDLSDADRMTIQRGANALESAQSALAQERAITDQLRKLLRPFAALANEPLSFAVVEYRLLNDPERQTFRRPQMHAAFNAAIAASASEKGDDQELPGMWSRSDFTGGEKS